MPSRLGAPRLARDEQRRAGVHHRRERERGAATGIDQVTKAWQAIQKRFPVLMTELGSAVVRSVASEKRVPLTELSRMAVGERQRYADAAGALQVEVGPRFLDPTATSEYRASGCASGTSWLHDDGQCETDWRIRPGNSAAGSSPENKRYTNTARTLSRRSTVTWGAGARLETGRVRVET